MTRPLHAKTRVQRGRSQHADPASHAREYERSDAPPVKVALVVAVFMMLVPTALGAAGLVASVWQSRGPTPSVAGRTQVQPPPPHLLADPPAEREGIEQAAAQRLQQGPETIDKAMADVARRGWNDEGAPPAQQGARGHGKMPQ
ncbi:hypothetical protein EDF56_11320 [Novosphingobium sp. PhB165]|uniref:hypothetical protein n=1 Tax=Novosphingobium sp. PhB165 TaxID=2485105 RepID=UPI001048AA81|nr:hypothetical protein [Novosphingobium sp. PhB165]TCM14375.1 hypothetical protein EDF56_11320 [Novosphingobium sp. PhB165]